MARIRSVHPGQWTDEDFVQMSPMARLLTLAIRNEADDHGIFEWKPITIKMRLMPVDNVDIGELLAEMEAHNQVRRFESGGRQYGAIRNFTKYQKPKSPSYTYPTPTDFGNDGSSSDDIPETVEDEPPEFPENVEAAPQRERREGKSREEESQERECERDFDEWYAAYPLHKGRGQAVKAYRAALKKVDHETLLAGAREAAGRYAVSDARFIPHPATWLNGERWLDDASPPPRSEEQARLDDIYPPEIYATLQ